MVVDRVGPAPSDCTGFPGITRGAARPPSARLRSPSGYPVPGEPRSPAGLAVLIPRTDRVSPGRTTAQSGGTIRASLTISPRILGVGGKLVSAPGEGDLEGTEDGVAGLRDSEQEGVCRLELHSCSDSSP